MFASVRCLPELYQTMLTLAVSVFLLSTTPALAQGAVAPVAAAPAKPVKERMICKRTAQTESRMAAKRICKTAAQWRQEATGSGEERDVSSDLGSRARTR